ncbi:hypothetical protein ACQPW1_39400 [Nocardia sp. CA-128927]|uniref:hypothetical protein n=1 Tax=Nocardia sp. CA-128927 TaxID=3239975 RepID=UPI003D95FC1E
MGFAENCGKYWRGRYRTSDGKHRTVLDDNGKPVRFATKAEAEHAADAAAVEFRRGDGAQLDFRAERERLSREAVALLTAAARQEWRPGHRADFTEFLAHVFAAVAANLGGISHLLAEGPSSSAESVRIRQLLHVTVVNHGEC